VPVGEYEMEDGRMLIVVEEGIISKEKMRNMRPDYLFVLIWSFRKEVVNQEIDYMKNLLNTISQI
jgi:hypothetical protein